MTSRDRRPSGRSHQVPRAPSAAPATGASRPAPAAEPKKSLQFVWDELFGGLSPEQRTDLLVLAKAQGILYAHQIPDSRNGVAAAVPKHGENLTSNWAGDVRGLDPVRPAPVAVHDTALDPAQQSAVARALATTDICLIHALPGTGKSRVVAEIVIQACQRGDRVLVLGRTAAAADRVIELVHSHASVLALRLLGASESPEALPATSRAMMPAERVRELSTRAIRDARQASARVEEECRGRKQCEPIWNQLQEISWRFEQLESQCQNLTTRRAAISEEVEREAANADGDPKSRFLKGITERRSRHQSTLLEIEKAIAEKHSQIESQGREEAELTPQIERLRAMADAWKARRLWSPAWWRALLHLGSWKVLPALSDRLRQVSASIAEVAQSIEETSLERTEAEKAHDEERAGLVHREVADRQSLSDDQMSALKGERELLREKWQSALAGLDPSWHPTDQHAASVQQARTAWRDQLVRTDQALVLLKRWTACLEETNPWSTRVTECANVIVTTAEGLSADTNGIGTGFDLLVLQDAEQFHEGEFREIAGRSRRCVLVGEPAPSPGRRFFDRLWQTLHWDPGSLPYAWVQEAGHLCCRLRPLTAEQRSYLERESLADFPDIELRILTLPKVPPVLAEVAFPASLPIADAKRFIFRELEELAVETSGRAGRWVEEPHRVVFRLTDDPPSGAYAVVLENGVREWIGTRTGGASTVDGCVPWHTYALEFEREAGWDRARAEEWVHRRLGARDLGRTARLDVPHRLHPHLAAFLSHVVFGCGPYGVSSAEFNGCAPRVEFVPVPTLPDRSASAGGKFGPARRTALSRKGGAGLEIDLSDPRQRTRLPADLFNALPNRGFVNHAEAQAIVDALQTLAAESASAQRVTVAVIALYPAQAELLRQLVRRVPGLNPAPFALSIDVAGAFRERESQVVFVSMTRSHSHRPLTFGEGPESLALALSRACARLVVFGDVGSLARRSQWEGPLEHLDETAAARERELIVRLVECLEDGGPHPAAFRLCEGVGA